VPGHHDRTDHLKIGKQLLVNPNFEIGIFADTSELECRKLLLGSENIWLLIADNTKLPRLGTHGSPWYVRSHSDAVQDRKKFRARNTTFAGRSASRRMKYGYQSLPNGT